MTPTPAAPTPAGAPAKPQPRTLTLEDSIAIALENNRAIQIAADRLQRAMGRAGEARAPARLQGRLEGSITRNDQKTSITLPASEGQEATSVTITPLYIRTARLSLSKPIDISGALRASRDIADLGAITARLEVERTQEQAILDVKNAFYQVLRAEAALGVAQADLASLKEHLQQARAFFNVGIAAQFDVLRAEAQVANASQIVISARNGVDLAKAVLNNVMGIDVTTPLMVRSEERVRIRHPDFDRSLQTAYERRAEVKQAQVGTEMARRGVSLARAGGLPTLAVSANNTLNLDGGAFSPRAFIWNATAAISFPLLDGGLTRSRVAQARADMDAARVSEEQVRQGVALEVRQSILSLSDAAERLEAAEKNLKQAQEALRLAKVRYKEGVSTPIEVTDAQAVLTQAETNLVNARYDYLLAQARYEHATGTTGEEEQASAAGAGEGGQ